MPAFFLIDEGVDPTIIEIAMNDLKTSMDQQIAQASIAFEQRRTGNHGPKSVTVIMREGTLVINLHGALEPAEKSLAKTPAGAAEFRELHRQLFSESSELLRQEIQRITGMEVCDAASEIEPVTGTVIQAFTTGNMVQEIQLTGSVPMETRTGNGV